MIIIMAVANPQTENLDSQGFDSVRFVIIRGGSPTPMEKISLLVCFTFVILLLHPSNSSRHPPVVILCLIVTALQCRTTCVGGRPNVVEQHKRRLNQYSPSSKGGSKKGDPTKPTLKRSLLIHFEVTAVLRIPLWGTVKNTRAKNGCGRWLCRA